MIKQEKLRKKFKSKPSDFTWSELKSMLSGMGYELLVCGKTGGSLVKFLHPGRPPIILHKPHPTPVLKRYQVEQLLDFLEKEGVI
mgnify:CR=1 FL=1